MLYAVGAVVAADDQARRGNGGPLRVGGAGEIERFEINVTVRRRGAILQALRI